jgi:carboxypeptidase Q
MIPCRGFVHGRCDLKRLIASACLVSMLVPALPAEERVDLEMVTKIRLEGFNNSKVMDTASELMDRIGPRLTGSPQAKAANEWTRDQLAKWGMANAHLEAWGPFGRGWWYEKSSVRMTAPDFAQLTAYPRPWTPGTSGVVKAKVVRLNPTSKDDLPNFKGRFAGKIVLYGDPVKMELHVKPDIERYDEKELAKIAEYSEEPRRRYDREELRKRAELRRAVDKFLEDEKPIAVIDSGRGDLGVFGVQANGDDYRMSRPLLKVPTLIMEPEHFGRIARLLDAKTDVELELDVAARFVDEDQMQWNTIAEIPGTDKKDEVVMLGAHLDSWQSGTGATDNGAGSVAVMEAMRILKAVGAKPRRTIRVALWTGEEQGLYGSKAYVDQHFASRPPYTKEELDQPFYMRKDKWPLTVKPEHAKLAAYFNLDNGSGKIRGIYCEDNAGVAPIFEAWLAPFRDLDAKTVTLNRTGGTDHQSFDKVGLPGFQFIQDTLDYETRTHHTNMDTYERLVKDDLMQASIILATFAYNAAMRDAMLPRKPLPQEPPAEKKDERTPAPGKPAESPAKPVEPHAAF